ncbi:hypothetical protein Pth03_66610 [Planotetraspora thailandica]|uniref:Uncharacterized protein n=2 Tax=Planotetraspora thailandica TaxID=487172 RepID=A0A8J3XZZ6_9ACTN|nr:hypothetical protein Pth03_66610 [Planotetraspora thailandica]
MAAWLRPTRARTLGQTVGRRPVNYRELGVEQLGSIYKGLLSFEPQIADRPRVTLLTGSV